MFYAVSTLNLNKRLVTSLCLEVEATITPCRSNKAFLVRHLSGLRIAWSSVCLHLWEGSHMRPSFSWQPLLRVWEISISAYLRPVFHLFLI